MYRNNNVDVYLNKNVDVDVYVGISQILKDVDVERCGYGCVCACRC